MEREPRGRKAASVSASPRRTARRAAPPRRRSLGSRVGVGGGAAQNTAPVRTAAPRAGATRPAPRPQPNPQKDGYRAGGGRAAHRVTRVERQRRRRRKAVVGALCVLAVLVLGVVLSINVLFKVTAFRIEAPDGTTPADTGIYTEEQILTLLGVQKGDNLLGFSTSEKSSLLAGQLPYLDEVTVRITLPGTVIIRLRPAVERFALEQMGGWLILSEERKVLRTSDTLPEGVALLQAPLPPEVPTLPGQFVTLGSYAAVTDDPQAEEQTGTAVPADEVLDALLVQLREKELLDGVTGFDLRDAGELAFLYQDRVRVRLGTTNNLDAKCKVAAQALLDANAGIGANEHGVLDVSYPRSDGNIWGYFSPGDPQATPTPPPATEEPLPDGEEPVG